MRLFSTVFDVGSRPLYMQKGRVHNSTEYPPVKWEKGAFASHNILALFVYLFVPWCPEFSSILFLVGPVLHVTGGNSVEVWSGPSDATGGNSVEL